MKKQITTIALGILMMNLALAIYAGSNISFETNLTNPVYTVTGNSSNLIGLNVTFENGSITISPALNYKPDNFTLIFFDEVTREVEKIVYRGGGGGSRTRYVDRNVTVYVPEYINTTEIIEVEVEKIIDRVEFKETGYEVKHIVLGVVSGSILAILIGLLIRRSLNHRGMSK